MFRTLEVKGRVFALDHSRIDAQVPLGEQNSAHTGEQMLNLLGQTRRVENLSDGSRSAQQANGMHEAQPIRLSRLAGPNDHEGPHGIVADDCGQQFLNHPIGCLGTQRASQQPLMGVDLINGQFNLPAFMITHTSSMAGARTGSSSEVNKRCVCR